MSTQQLNSLLDTFAAPQLVFKRIREKSISFWIPLSVLVLGTLLVYGWYFMSVDMYQFMETSMLISGQSASPDEMDLILQNEAVLRIVPTASAVIGTLVVLLIMALYFFLAAALLAEERYGFGQFLSLVAWGSLPGLITLLSTGVTYALSDEFLYLTELDKTSLATILGMSYDSANFNLASALTVGNVWSYVLYGVGFSILTRTSTVTTTIVAVIPPAIHFGLTYLL